MSGLLALVAASPEDFFNGDSVQVEPFSVAMG